MESSPCSSSGLCPLLPPPAGHGQRKMAPPDSQEPTVYISAQLLTTLLASHQPHCTREARWCKTTGLQTRGIRTSPDHDSSNSLSLGLQETSLCGPCHRQRGQYPSEVSPPPLFHTNPHGSPRRGQLDGDSRARPRSLWECGPQHAGGFFSSLVGTSGMVPVRSGLSDFTNRTLFPRGHET